MRRGVRWIQGREFLLAGRCSDKAKAVIERNALRNSWERVRIIKLWQYDFLLYVHGGKSC